MAMTGAPAKGETRKRRGRIAFIALRETIRTEIEQGWPLTAIYEKHAGQLGIGYSQFTRYVGVHIRGAGKAASISRTGSGQFAFLLFQQFQQFLRIWNLSLNHGVAPLRKCSAFIGRFQQFLQPGPIC